MTKPFSERNALGPARSIQTSEVNTALRNRLFNCVTVQTPSLAATPYELSGFGKAICDRFFKEPVISTQPDGLTRQIHELFAEGAWYRLYDYLEFIASLLATLERNKFIQRCNRTLEQELSAYRFVGGTLVDVATKAEVAAIEAALQHPLQAAREHIAKSLKLLGERPAPNYSKVVAEALQAVEAVARHLIGDESATLGEALKRLKRVGTHHPALVDAFSKIYGWSSDEGGARHAAKGPPVDAAWAKFMLIACSAFIGYLLELKADS